MPLSNEDAQGLIAEIKKYMENTSNMALTAVTLEKIVNRFANRLPKEGLVFNVNEANDNVFIRPENDGFVAFYIYPTWINPENDGWLFSCNAPQLKQLRDNCTKMLEYLNDEKL